jgi:hypothetical protein
MRLIRRNVTFLATKRFKTLISASGGLHIQIDRAFAEKLGITRRNLYNMIEILIGWDLLEWASPKGNECCFSPHCSIRPYLRLLGSPQIAFGRIENPVTKKSQLATAAHVFKNVLIDRNKQGLPAISAVAAKFEVGVKARTMFEMGSVLRGWDAIEIPANARYELRKSLP